MMEANQEKRILFIGASGSGTTTLGKLISKKLNIPHFDLDDFFWKPTEIPYTEFRNKAELLALMEKDLYSKENWIISGDPSEWEVGIETKLTSIYFLECPSDIRVTRLNERELQKQGDKILKGGANYNNHMEFIEWTKKYDEGGITGRSREKQEYWIKELTCAIYRLNTNRTKKELVNEILKTIKATDNDV